MKNFLIKLFKNKLFVSFAVNALIMVFCIYVSSFSYDSYNDYVNSLLISHYHIPYNNNINYLLAFVVSSIQYLVSTINIFVFSQVIFGWLAFSSITYALTDKFGYKKGIVFSVFLNILFALNHYADIASQKTSAILLTAGFLLVFNAIRRKRYRFMCFLGIAEIILGTFYCFQLFYVALPFAIIYLVADLIAKGKYKIKFRKFMWYFRPFLILFVLITVVVVALNNYTISVNTQTDSLKNNYEYNELTDKIANYPYPDYTENEEAFNNAGITKTEYELLKDGYYDASTPLNLDSLRLVDKLQSQNSGTTVWNEFIEFLSASGISLASFDNDAMLIIIYIIFVALYLVFHKKTHMFFPILITLQLIVSNTLLRYFYNGYYYTVYISWIMAYCVLLYSIDFAAFKNGCNAMLKAARKGTFFVSAMLVVTLLLVNCLVYQSHLHNNIDTKSRPSRLYVEVERHPERYYILDCKTAIEYTKYSTNYIHPMWGFRTNYLSNVDSFGFTHRDAVLQKKGADSVYNAAINIKNVYIIDNYITYKKENYFKKYYSTDEKKNYFYKLETEIDGYKLYSVV